MKILFLHAVDFPSRTRGTTLKHAGALARYSDAEVLYQHGADPATDELKAMPFDAVMLDASLLCMRWARPLEALTSVQEQWRWIADVDAVRIALPQDDYDHAHVLDDWLADWNVDLIYTVLPRHVDAVYPRCSATAEFRHVLCGYIDDDDIDAYGSRRRPFDLRRIDVGYRVREIPAQFGRFGRLKSRLGRAFLDAAGAGGLVLDIGVGDAGTLYGDDWRSFLGDCRYSLGAEGGSGVLDRRGEVRDRVAAARAAAPTLSEDELIELCLRPDDERLTFSVPSPRILEIALAESCPVLVRGDYFGRLRPEEHYIPVDGDFGNLPDVVKRLSDHGRARVIAAANREALLSDDTLRYRTFVARVLQDIERNRRAPQAAARFPRDAAMMHQWRLREHWMDQRRIAETAYEAEIARLARGVDEARVMIERAAANEASAYADRDRIAEEGRRLIDGYVDEARRAYADRDRIAEDGRRKLEAAQEEQRKCAEERDLAQAEARRAAKALAEATDREAALMADLECVLQISQELSNAVTEIASSPGGASARSETSSLIARVDAITKRRPTPVAPSAGDLRRSELANGGAALPGARRTAGETIQAIRIFLRPRTRFLNAIYRLRLVTRTLFSRLND